MNRRLSILLTLASILLWAILVSACKPETSSQVSQTVVPSIPPVLTVTAVDMSNDTTDRLPSCQFTQDVSVTTSALQTTSIDKYVLSKPTVVMTSSEKTSTLDVVQWLPDNRRLLVKRSFPSTRRKIFEVLDTITGQSQIYAESKEGGGGFWLAPQQAVVYSERVAVDEAKGQWRTEWWIGDGDPIQAQRVITDMPYYRADFDVNRQQIIQWQTNMTLPQSLDPLSSILPVQDVAFNPEQWIYRKYPESFEPVFEPSAYSFVAASRNDGSLIAFYGAPWLFLLDTRTNQACEVDLGISAGNPWRATRAQWSPSGRYLALKLLADLPDEMATNWQIMILDTVTGGTYKLNDYSDGLAWVPAQDHLLMLDNFTLVDITTGKLRKLAEEAELKNVLWAAPQWTSDGHTIAANCYSRQPNQESGICLIGVTTQP